MPIAKKTAQEMRVEKVNYLTVESDLISEIEAHGAEALAVWIHLVHKHEGWKVREKEVIDTLKISRPRYQKAIRGLKQCGVVTRRPIFCPDTGKLAGSEIVVSNTKQDQWIEADGEPTTGNNTDRSENTTSRDSRLVGNPDGSEIPTGRNPALLTKYQYLPIDQGLPIERENAREPESVDNSPMETPQERFADNPEFEQIRQFYRSYGQCKPADAKAHYSQRVSRAGLHTQFANGLQDYLNQKANQRSPSYQRLENFIRQESWLGCEYPAVDGTIRVPGASDPPSKADQMVDRIRQRHQASAAVKIVNPPSAASKEIEEW